MSGLLMAAAAARGAAVVAPEAEITFVGATIAQGSGFAQPAKPTGLAEGDHLLAWVTYDSTGAVFNPSGWTSEDADGGTATIASPRVVVSLFSKIAGGSEPATYTFLDSEELASFVRVVVAAYRGCTFAGVTGVIEAAAITPAATSHPSGAVTPEAASSLLVYFAASEDGLSSWTPPGGTTERVPDGASGQAFVVLADVIEAGTDPVSLTATIGGAKQGVNVLIALTPAGA